MKKIVSLMVAVMMLCCLTVTAFAGGYDSKEPTTFDMKQSSVVDSQQGKISVPASAVTNPNTNKDYTFSVEGVTYTFTFDGSNWVGTPSAAAAPTAVANVVAEVTAGTLTAPVVIAAANVPGGNYVISGNGTGVAAGAAAGGTAAGVSPQTGETVTVYAVAAVVMAAAAAAFVVKARKA